jgi:lysophospholipase L1-like esterase
VLRRLQNAGLAAVSLLLTLLLLELGVRLFVPTSRWLFLDATRDWQIDRGVGWINKPNLDTTSQTPFGWVRFRTNPDGLIPFDAAHEKPPGVVRVMVFGDSMTVGRSVAQDEIYTARLEQALRERGISAEVINAGVQGYSTDQSLLLMQRWIPVYRPDLVLYGSTLNDYAGNTLDHAYKQAKPKFHLGADGKLALSLPDVKSAIEEPGGFRYWMQRSALYRLLQPGIALIRSRMFGVQERILLGTEQGVYIGDATIDALDWRLYEALVAEMDATARSLGAGFLIFAHPEVGEVWEPYIESVCRQQDVPRRAYDPFAMQRRLVALAERRHLEFMPTIEAFRRVPERGPFHLLPMDAHMNSTGHALLAELLTERTAQLLGSRAPADDASRKTD